MNLSYRTMLHSGKTQIFLDYINILGMFWKTKVSGEPCKENSCFEPSVFFDFGKVCFVSAFKLI